MQKLFFRTAESIPPPYANQIELIVYADATAGISLEFEQTYLQRDELEEDEIYEEGFTTEDDMAWKGELNQEWKKAFGSIWEQRKQFKSVAGSAHDYFQLNDGENLYSPTNADDVKRFLEQLQQAIFEIEGKEAPLNIDVLDISASGSKNTLLSASFKNRSYTQTINSQPVAQHWNQLDEHLKLIFAGDFLYEKASNKTPTKPGLYVNMGDEWWFEVGKSLLIQPTKISGFIV